MSSKTININFFWIFFTILLIISLLFTQTSLITAKFNNDDYDDEDDDDENELYKNASRAFGIVTGPLLFLGGVYVIHMWTRRVQVHLLTEYIELDPSEVKKLQRFLKPWLHRFHMLANGIALGTASVHTLGTLLRNKITEGGFSHLMIWLALTLMLLYLVSGLILKLRLFPPKIRRQIRYLHKSPIIIFLLAGVILGHVVLIDD
ncbi:MAG: hypothetical protein ACFFCQ_06825 [Promethearchaeota archaeon]